MKPSEKDMAAAHQFFTRAPKHRTKAYLAQDIAAHVQEALAEKDAQIAELVEAFKRLEDHGWPHIDASPKTWLYCLKSMNAIWRQALAKHQKESG